MKKIYFALALGFICAVFTACRFKSAEQKAVEEQIRASARRYYGEDATVTFRKIVVLPHEARSEYGDSVYHVYLTLVKDDPTLNNYNFAYQLDSVGVQRRDYPAYTEYYYDCMIKNSHNTYPLQRNFKICNGEKYNESIYRDSPIIDKVTVLKKRYFLKGGSGAYCAKRIKKGGWYTKSQLDMDSYGAISTPVD